MLGQVMQQVMAQLLGPNGPGGGLGGPGGGLAGPVGGPAGGAFPIPPPLPLMFDWDDLFFDMFEEDELLDEEEEEMDEEGDSDAEFELGVLPGGDGEEGGGAGGEWTAWGFGGLEWMDCEAWRQRRCCRRRCCRRRWIQPALQAAAPGLKSHSCCALAA